MLQTAAFGFALFQASPARPPVVATGVEAIPGDAMVVGGTTPILHPAEFLIAVACSHQAPVTGGAYDAIA
jgi:hypothetical protein